ncbi:FtsX-like permease family protein [Niallia sp. 03133]|uniref:FtsX-like permease family protein n=1 Tax=Niallia sp. 03133 TaxID=3458060 RepID=UPI0040447BCC
MNINQLILRNLKKNIKNYYLYVLALIFSVSLYFAFVTLQYDPSMDATKGSLKGGASIRAASILLVAIVGIFLFYANTIFIKRRSKEIGLFQLIGMTKDRIFRILITENIILYFGSLLIGTFIGFSFSKLAILILFKITGVKGIATLHFSSQALIQTILVFCAIYVFIMLMNYIFIKRQTILALFRVKSSSEGRVKKLSIWEMLMGIVGIILVIVGYYLSSRLFSGDFITMNQLFMAMVGILASVIIGTYLVYKGSVSFISNIIRKSKNGYLNINEVLSLSTIMFRMKSNALLLTIITTVSALAIGLLSLSYITYYSAEKSAKKNIPNQFAFSDQKTADTFKQALSDKNISIKETNIPVIQVSANVKNILAFEPKGMTQDMSSMQIAVVSENSVKEVENLGKEEVLFTGYNDALQRFMGFKDKGIVTFTHKKGAVPLHYLGLNQNTVVSFNFTSGGLPTAIVDQAVFDTLFNNIDKKIQMKNSTTYTGIDLNDETKLEMANQTFHGLALDQKFDNHSRLDMLNEQKKRMGLTMFIVAFLGLAFLITSGCILYFKQMDEGEDEKYNYKILRKLGYTRGDLLRGIQGKQLFNFGIPLIVGLLHSYFAVQSGWFFFGTELWTPMIIVMVLYTALYSIFGVLSVFYYKKVIKAAL